MAITDINISEQLQTDAPSIKYTGNEGPQASPQHQQEQMVARQIWEALGPEQQGQFQSFEQFFQSGVWKQILQQMQQDEGQGPETQQGIRSLGPQPMEQQRPMPRMGAEYGGRMGYQSGEMVEESIVEKLRPGSVDIIEKIKEGIMAGGDRAMGIPGVDESIWIEKLLEHLRKKRGEGRPDPRFEGREEIEQLLEGLRPDVTRPIRPERPVRPLPRRPFLPTRPLGSMPNRIGAYGGGDMEELSMRETIDTPEGIETLKETDTMEMAGGGARGWKAQEIAMDWAWDRYGKEFYDLTHEIQMSLYSEALDFVDSGGE